MESKAKAEKEREQLRCERSGCNGGRAFECDLGVCCCDSVHSFCSYQCHDEFHNLSDPESESDSESDSHYSDNSE